MAGNCNLVPLEVKDFPSETDELKALGISVVDQSSIEKNVQASFDNAVTKHSRKQKIQLIKQEINELHLESKILENKKESYKNKLVDLHGRNLNCHKYLSMEKELKTKIKRQREILERGDYLNGILKMAEENEEILDDVNLSLEEGEILEEESGQQSDSQKRDLVMAGEMTPFGTIMNSSVPPTAFLQKQSETTTNKYKELPSSSTSVGGFKRYLQDQLHKQKKFSYTVNSSKRTCQTSSEYGVLKKRKKVKEFFGSQGESNDNKVTIKRSPLKMKILHPKHHFKHKNLGSKTSELDSDKVKTTGKLLSEVTALHDSEHEEPDSDFSEYVPSDSAENDSNVKMSPCKRVKKKTSIKVLKTRDDAYIEDYDKRIKEWRRTKASKQCKSESSDEEDDYEQFEGGYKIPLHIWNKLYKYQKICVKWLWELHCQGCGGILGDEMGLGKTIEIISFLAGLSFSGLSRGDTKGLGPVLIVSPATVLHQWVKELHKWWPIFRVAILHGSGVFTGKRNSLIHNINRFGGILVTSYTGLRSQLNTLLQYEWDYIILDEGHKIRNPEAQITVAVKRFQTVHRLILSGSPIQNSLKELWSLFDFVFPGKLGSLPVFLQEFAVPITQGGYANASKIEVQTAYRCATVLRDTINPYLLRRMKNDVRNHLTLPDKNEQVLFCGLTDEQRSVYQQYLDGDHIKNILRGRFQVFVGLINLRKICNHPDLYTRGPKKSIASGLQPELQYGWYKHSGKMLVLHEILKLWNKQSHRVLLFTQSRQMLFVLEKYIQDENYTYIKMDGSTSVGSRQTLIDKYNSDSSIFLFLLTTRVGGLGVNLTGADRVVIFDPDWNPSTDSQARERAWRIGQLRNVTIYRLLTAGTVEEKIYQRQIFKQFLTNRILKDPKQQRFFKTNDLYELFTLHESEKEKTESAALFAGTGSEIKMKKEKDTKVGNEEKNKVKGRNSEIENKEKGNELKKKEMLELAKLISKKIVSQKTEDIVKVEINKIKTEKSSKKKKSKKGNKFEGKRIQYLIKKKNFAANEEEENAQVKSKTQDEYVLKKLFKRSGVHTALSHDAIENTGDPDYLLLESEADRVAKEAMKRVRASRNRFQGPPPKLTPKKPLFGTKKNPLIGTKDIPKAESSKYFDGLFNEDEIYIKSSHDKSNTAVLASAANEPNQLSIKPLSTTVFSSSHLLQKMKQRNDDAPANPENDDEESISTESLTEDSEYVELLTNIRNFVAFQSNENGKASTDEVVERFKDRLPKTKSHIFKALLKEICHFIRDSSGIGYWYLKGEFR